jgi:hypothetical protein
VAVVLAASLALSLAPAAAKGMAGGGQGAGAYGLGAGVLLPEKSFSDFNDYSYFIQSRSLYVEKVFGGRAAAYYGDTEGKDGADGGRVYGFDFDAVVKFGSPSVFGYVFGGAGYGKLTFTSAGLTPGSSFRQSDYNWCWTGGLGLSFKKKHGFYLEASYVEYQTTPKATFIPVVLGFQY